MKKKLSLRRESLSDLSPSDLASVVGADDAPTIAICQTGLTGCKVCNDLLPTVHNGCTPSPAP